MPLLVRNFYLKVKFTLTQVREVQDIQASRQIQPFFLSLAQHSVGKRYLVGIQMVERAQIQQQVLRLGRHHQVLLPIAQKDTCIVHVHFSHNGMRFLRLLLQGIRREDRIYSSRAAETNLLALYLQVLKILGFDI